MAVDGATMTTMNKAMKTDYLPRIRQQLEDSTPTLHVCERITDYTVGNFAYMPLGTGRNEGISYAEEGGDLNEPGYQQYDNATYPMKYMYLQIGVTGPGMAATQNKRGAYAKVLMRETERGLTDLKKDVNRMLLGDGTGLRAVIDNTATITADNPSIPIASGINYCAKTQLLDILPLTSSPTSHGTVTVTGVTKGATPSIAVTGTYTQIVPDQSSNPTGLFRKGSFANVPYGLDAIISTENPPMGVETVGGIDRTTAGNEFWQANAFTDSATRPISQDLMDSAFDQLDSVIGKLPTVGLCRHAVARRIAGLLIGTTQDVTDKRRIQVQGPISTIDGGWRAVTWNNVPIYVDVDMTPERLYLWSAENIFVLQPDGEAGEWNWMDEDGAVLKRVPNKDAFQGMLRKYCNLATDTPLATIGIYQIAES